MLPLNQNHPLVKIDAVTKDAKRIDVADFSEERDLYMAMAQWMWRQYSSGRCYFAPDGTCENNRTTNDRGVAHYSIAELRAYSRGEQSIHPYQRLLDPGRLEPNGKHLLNINWTPPSILPKIVSQLEGLYDPVTFDYRITAADTRAKQEREQRRAKMRLAISQEWNQIEQTVGVQASNKVVPKGVQSQEDLDIMFRFGGDKLAAEIKMEAAIRAALKDCEYSGVVSEQIKRDAIDLGFIATEVRVDPVTGRPTIDYADPAGVIVPNSRYRDFRDAGYCGRVVRLKIHELVSELMAEGMDLMDAELTVARLATQHAGVFSGTQADRLRSVGYADEDEIHILRGYFIAGNVQRYVLGKHHRTGSDIYAPVSRDSQLRSSDVKRGKRLQDVTVQNVYRFSWIIGSESIYDFGPDYAIAREGKNGQKRAGLPVQAYRLDSPSMVARCIPIVDDMTLATYKKRDGMAKVLPAPGIMIDLALIEDELVIGGERVSFAELLGLAYRSGVLMYQSTDEALARGLLNGTVPPVREANMTAVIRTIETFAAEINTGLMEIRNVTGLNELQDNTARPDLLVGIARGMQASTNNSLLHVFRAYLNISRQAVSYVVLKYQALLHYGDLTVYDIPVEGGPAIEYVITHSEGDYDFVLGVEGRPTAEEREELTVLAVEAQRAGILEIPDYIEFQRLIRAGQMNSATMYLAIAIDRTKRRAQESQERMISMNSEAQQQSALAAEEAKRQTTEFETQMDITLHNAKVAADLRKELVLLQAKGEAAMVQAGVQDSMQADDEQMQSTQ